jgi:hypothetical protein
MPVPAPTRGSAQVGIAAREARATCYSLFKQWCRSATAAPARDNP